MKKWIISGFLLTALCSWAAVVAPPSMTGKPIGDFFTWTGTVLSFAGQKLSLVHPTSTSQFEINRGVTTGGITITGSNASGGGSELFLYGGAHASLVNNFYLKSNSQTIIGWDATAGTLTTKGLMEDLHGYIASVTNATYPLVAYNRVARQVDKIALKCSGTTITAKLQIGGVDITTCTAISVTSTVGDTTCDTGSTNNLAAAGRLTLITSSDSSCGNLEWSIQTTRD